jgi:hypothetical protein
MVGRKQLLIGICRDLIFPDTKLGPPCSSPRLVMAAAPLDDAATLPPAFATKQPTTTYAPGRSLLHR